LNLRQDGANAIGWPQEWNRACHHRPVEDYLLGTEPSGFSWGAFDSAKNHKRQRRKRQSVTAKREKSQTPKFV